MFRLSENEFIVSAIVRASSARLRQKRASCSHSTHFVPTCISFAATPNTRGQFLAMQKVILAHGSVNKAGSMPQSFGEERQRADGGGHCQPVRR
jgi:hypothetical protein